MLEKINNYVSSLKHEYKNKEIFLYDVINNNGDILSKLSVYFKHNDIYYYCLYEAVCLDKYELVEAFINNDFPFEDIILIACKNNNLRILKLLFDNSSCLYLDEKHVKNIINTNNLDIIKLFLFNKTIIIKKRMLNITNEKYDIYKLFYENDVNLIYCFYNDNKSNDYIDFKAYCKNDISFLKYCISKNCTKNPILINEVIKNNDINTLKYLYCNDYRHYFNNIDLKTVESQEILLFLFSSNKKNNKIINDEFVIHFISNKKHKFVCHLLKNINVISNDVYLELIKNYDDSYDNFILSNENKNNDLISLFASKYNDVLFSKILDSDILIHNDCILYICEKKNLIVLEKLLDKISKHYLTSFHGIINKYKNLLCDYFTNDEDIFNVLKNNNYLLKNNYYLLKNNANNEFYLSETENILHYLFKYVNENNLELYHKIFRYYKPYLIYHYDIINTMIYTDENRLNIVIFLLTLKIKFNKKINVLLDNISAYINEIITIETFNQCKNKLQTIFNKFTINDYDIATHSFSTEFASCVICFKKMIDDNFKILNKIYDKKCDCNYLIDVECAEKMKHKQCVYKCGMIYS